MAHAGGRPTKLTKALIQQANAYLDECSNMSAHTLLPTIEGMALHLHISRDTLYEWEKEYPEFSDILNDLRAYQANKLIQNSLAGRYNSTISKLLLSKHDYVEKSAVEQSGEQKVTVEIKKFTKG